MTKTASDKPTTPASRLSKLKIYFLHVLIAGLGLAAIISVVALLIGEFNAVIGKTMLTIFLLFSNSLLLLGLLWVDKNDQIGRSIIPTTIFAAVFANFITSTLTAWDILSAETSVRWMGVYFLAIGGAFIISALLGMRSKQQAASIASTTSIGFVAITLASLIPWILNVAPHFDPLYFRVVAALSILSSASFLISLILQRIAKSKNPEEKKKPIAILPNGMLAVYIVVGIATFGVWTTGLSALVANGVDANSGYSEYN